MTRVGFVGCGHIARSHAHSLSRIRDTKIVAGSDPDVNSARRLTGYFGAKAFDDPVEMLNAVDLDALYVCSPPFARGEAEAEAARRGIHLFLEKPVAANLAQAKKIAASLNDDIVVSVAYNWRYMPNVPRIRRILAKNPARAFIATWKEALPDADWWRKVATSGGPVIEQASHLLDVGMFLLGPVKRVWALAGSYRPKDFGDIDDLVMAHFEFECGAMGQLLHTCLLNQHVHRIGYDIITWKKEISVDRHARTVIRSAGRTEEFPGSFRESYVAENKAFIDAVRTGRRKGVLCDFRGGMESLALGDAIAKSARTGRGVAVEKV